MHPQKTGNICPTSGEGVLGVFVKLELFKVISSVSTKLGPSKADDIVIKGLACKERTSDGRVKSVAEGKFPVCRISDFSEKGESLSVQGVGDGKLEGKGKRVLREV